MNRDYWIASLLQYGIDRGLIEKCDLTVARNMLLSVLKLDACTEQAGEDRPLEEILDGLLADAVERGVCGDSITERDLLDTALMGVLTPMPREVRKKFRDLYAVSPEKATDWYYRFSTDTNYIRSDRIKKDMKWKTATQYGELDITINLSKPEKDPKAIAAARTLPQSGYPMCMLCAENEGYAGRLNHPARQNHRIVPISICGDEWFLQYSPYVYYTEHCIAFNTTHTPMVIDRAAFDKLLDFVTLFPHYFIGSNADLPIVGGSILSHEHFQGGHYDFPMARSEIETPLSFDGYTEITAGIVKWPMSVIRISGEDRKCLAELADKILQKWREYSDPAASVFAETSGEKHNTITPIARRRGSKYELDLVLRNNITTQEHPLGLFHPHEELHHIKRENIGLIEVMGLAVLPARLRTELEKLKVAILTKADISADADLAKHAPWVREMYSRRQFTEENIDDILREEIGLIFEEVLTHAGVYKRTPAGKDAFLRFVDAVNMP